METCFVSVTAEHIADGDRHACASCPVALALTDSLRLPESIDLSVCPSVFWLTCVGTGNCRRFGLPLETREFIWAFDSGRAVSPFEFCIDGEPVREFLESNDPDWKVPSNLETAS